ncbi:hypothetical protein D7Y13_27655 [Corallococcus praedator]|uniref:Outer membrane protein beta-barrel domain-containing protein n=1 Tax=Corallococcus praedator TaxID=2316724 RepID=A0ABX9QB96_9BACT|nr:MULTISPECIES: hypothetical protein [Corallococcus]RKH15979.1 hypothetical protein D7X74_16795 [Corallococcus sp. CA047B]RKH27745.1 hypothetical protein D7X75_26010 [Corallococcus sp. CA031C]RKH99719.1 hypothetical protein D7Y13_27655 [Corallococcus praedator]
MSLPKVMLCGGLLTGLLAAPPAEARFGKRSDSSEDSKPVHQASAIDDDGKKAAKSDEENENRAMAAPKTVSSSDDCCSSSASNDVAAVIVGAVFELVLRGLGEVIVTTGTHRAFQPDDPAAPPPLPGSGRHAAPFSFRTGVLVAPLQGGPGMDFSLGWDVHRFGADLRVTRLDLARAGTDSRSERTLGELHVTYSPVVHESLRVRAELGVSTADAPQGLYVGPSLGMSLEACVLGPLDVEARMQVTPFPYRQVDVRSGLALHLGGFMLRGGVRGLYLDPSVSVGMRDRLFGPEFGVGFVF